MHQVHQLLLLPAYCRGVCNYLEQEPPGAPRSEVVKWQMFAVLCVLCKLHHKSKLIPKQTFEMQSTPLISQSIATS